jgi:hypothetical protein
MWRILSREARKARGAQGIGAEILFYRFAVKKIEAESPVFLPAPRAKKCAKPTNMKKVNAFALVSPARRVDWFA